MASPAGVALLHHRKEGTGSRWEQYWGDFPALSLSAQRFGEARGARAVPRGQSGADWLQGWVLPERVAVPQGACGTQGS